MPTRGIVSYWVEDIKKIKQILKQSSQLGTTIQISDIVNKGHFKSRHVPQAELDKIVLLLEEIYTLINRCEIPPSITDYIYSMFNEISVMLKGYNGDRTPSKNRHT